MKILFLYPTIYPDFIGGVEHRNWELGAALARRGHQVTLAGLCNRTPAPTAQLAVMPMGRLGELYNAKGKRSTRAALRFAWLVPRLDLSPYDLVETANIPYIHVFPLALQCALARKPLLVTWYEYWGPYWKRYLGSLRAPVYRVVEWLTAQLGTAVTATSRLTRDRLAKNRFRGTVALVPCGIHVRAVREAPAQGERGAGPPLIFAGRLLEEKRIDLLLRAVARLADAGGHPPGVLLTVFGEGPYRDRLQDLASALGVADRVDFRGHVADNVEVWRELGRARVAVQPSEREGFGLFPLEAMAAGLPVVYCESTESAVPELVRHGVEGVQCRPDPEELAAVLDRLLTDADEWERLSANARERAKGYDWDEIARQIEEGMVRMTSPA